MADETKHYYAPVTQSIANRLPPHSDIRRKKTSIGQGFLNSIAGIHIQDILEQLSQGTADLFPISAGLNEPDQLRVVQLPDEFERPVTETNLIRNGSFGLWASDTRGPDEWDFTGTIEKTTGAFSDTGLKLTGLSTLSQKRDGVLRSGSSITASIWYLNPSGSVATLLLKGTTNTGSVLSNGSSLVSSVSRWTQVSVTLTLTQDIVDYTFELDVTSGDVSVDAGQLVLGTSPRSWRPSIFDKLRWYEFPDGPVIPPVAVEFGKRVQIVEDVRDFWRNVPTRIELRGTRVIDKQTASAGFITEFDHNDDAFLTEWKPNGSKIRKVGRASQSADIYGDFDFLFPDTKEGEVESVTVTAVEAVALFNNRLWVILTATAFDSQTRRMLAIVNPNYPRPTPSELQVEAAYIIDVPSVVAARFKFDDPLWLYLHDGTTEYGIRLFYDYGIYVANDLKIYLREEYSSFTTIQMAPRKRDIEVRLTRKNT